MNNIRDWRDQLERRRGVQQGLLSRKEKGLAFIKKLSEKMSLHEKALEIVKIVALDTQNQLSYNISEITALALEAVLQEPYNLDLDFVEKRNKTECEIYFSRDDLKIKPYDGGGGPVDVAAFALRIASWSMNNPRTRNTLILDEPFKHLKGEETNRKMLEMVKMVSEKLNVQIIMVSDERVNRDVTIEVADKVFETSIKNGKTKLQIK